jgi:hypothetical protein
VDQLTEEQKQLVKQGHPVPPVREAKKEELLSEDSD